MEEEEEEYPCNQYSRITAVEFRATHFAPPLWRRRQSKEMSGRNIGPASTSSDSSAHSSFSVSHRYNHGSSNHVTVLSEGSAKVCITIDLVAAARRHLFFLRSIAGSLLLRHPTAILRSIRRYDEMWMPLMADLSCDESSAPMLLPPLDVEWIWLCHCLDSTAYREYCVLKFGAIIDRPAILDEENEEYAAERCREIWNTRHPSEPFDFEINADDSSDGTTSHATASSSCGIFSAVSKHSELYSFFSDPFVPEIVYLASARRRYVDFLLLMKKSAAENFRMIPAADIRLMWHTHQSFPGIYAADTEEMGDFGRRILGFQEPVAKDESETTIRAWEAVYGQPYELAGASLNPPALPGRLVFTWDASNNNDVNRHYKGLQPRFLTEVVVFLKGRLNESNCNINARKTFLRLKTVRSHNELKLDTPTLDSFSEQWRKTWHLFCEFSTRGIVIEVRTYRSGFLRKTKLLKKVYFYWNDLLRSTTLTLTEELEFQIQALSSITPPVQAAYLLRNVPDCVTDDSGAMISDVILRMNRYRPQDGRWLSRTVLDHARRECFVIRTRVGRGFWRRGDETPALVKWEDRIVEVREGQWSYVASSVGSAPDKVVGIATPSREDGRAVWSFSTGHVLTIQWEHGLSFQIQNESSDQSVLLQVGRKMQYQVKEGSLAEEQNYITIVRVSPESRVAKATALLNWKLQAAEILPEENAVFALLVNMTVLRTLSQVKGEDIGGLLVLRRVQQVGPGLRDWGSVILPGDSSNGHLPQFKPWYWGNDGELLAMTDDWRGQYRKYAPADGKDELYRASILS